MEKGKNTRNYVGRADGLGVKHSHWEKIDMALAASHLFRLANFHYEIGNCLFDALAVLLHFRYTSIEIREAIVNHFRICLDQNDPDALLSMHTDLAVEYLSELHGIENVDVYLTRMSQSASQANEQNVYGLWGDIFCIKWFSKWLNVPIAIWSLTRETKYLHFNSKQTGYCYNLLFHDHTPASGHFEPLLSYR